jgi:hypothetical protein
MATSWSRVAGVWLLIILVETVHGILRTLFVAPVVGDFRARQIAVFTGSVLILAVAWLTRRWIGASTHRDQLMVGLAWAGGTVLFEIGLGRLLGLSWGRILEDYNLARGGLMSLGLVILTLAPMITATMDARLSGRTAARART